MASDKIKLSKANKRTVNRGIANLQRLERNGGVILGLLPNGAVKPSTGTKLIVGAAMDALLTAVTKRKIF